MRGAAPAKILGAKISVRNGVGMFACYDPTIKARIPDILKLRFLILLTKSAKLATQFAVLTMS
jgi:hypothetical protein